MAEKAFEPTGMLGPQIFGLPIDRETLFSNHKQVYKKRIEKRQRRLIVKLAFLTHHGGKIGASSREKHEQGQEIQGFLHICSPPCE